MRLTSRMLRRVPWLAAGFLATASIGACSHPQSIYDSGYNDRHRWDRREEAAYRRWEAERQLEHLEYDRRSAEDQRAYWAWRHQHPDV